MVNTVLTISGEAEAVVEIIKRLAFNGTGTGTGTGAGTAAALAPARGGVPRAADPGGGAGSPGGGVAAPAGRPGTPPLEPGPGQADTVPRHRTLALDDRADADAAELHH